MGSSKRKSSFRIDDILHHQQSNENTQLLAQQLAAIRKSNTDNNNIATSTTSAPLTPPTSMTSSNPSPVSSSSSPQDGPSLGASSTGLMEPRKPQAMYHHPSNFMMPLHLGLPTPFPPAATYFEHYANALHKGKIQFCTFYYIFVFDLM